MTGIEKTGGSFLKQQIFITAGMALVGLFVMRVWFADGLLAPIVVSVCFSLLVSFVSAYVWKRVARGNAENLTTYYTASSGARLLAALATMLVYYLVRGGQGMLEFFLVFAAFYVALLAHHSVFFSRVSNRL